MKLIIDILEELYEAYKGRQPMLGDAGMDMIAQAIANGTLIPDNATNGDVLQNMFPDDIWLQIYVRRAKKSVDWWNSPYQKGGKE